MIPYIVLGVYLLATILHIGFIFSTLAITDGDLMLKIARTARLIILFLNFIVIAFALYTLGNFILAIVITILTIISLIGPLSDGYYIIPKIFSSYNIIPLITNVLFKLFIILFFIALKEAGSFDNLMILFRDVLTNIF